MSYDQLINPNLSVGIFAQNGVYMFFSAAFVPVLFGIYLKNVDSRAPLFATITAVVVYPAVAGALAIVASYLIGVLSHWILKNKTKIEVDVA
mgnify:CR=1 FL=1